MNADTILLRQALEALEYHREQTRPITQTDEVIDALRARLRPDCRAQFVAWWRSEPHRLKYANDHPAYLAAAEAWQAARATLALPDEALDAAVNRFLGWELPRTFAPDGGVVFNREVQTMEGKRDRADMPGWWPIGTNLFTADQAKAMLEHALGIAGVES